MTLLQSISHPELIVGSDGTIFYNGQKLNKIKDHCYASRGPMIYYWHEGKQKQLFVIRLVFEAHIKKAVLTKGEYIDSIDGDENNTQANNLQGRSKKTAQNRKIRPCEKESTYTWMGIDEVYC